MKIQDIKTYAIKSRIKLQENLWKERLIRPVDIYPKFKQETFPALPVKHIRGDEYETTSTFVEVVTDEGVSGISGPLGAVLERIQAVIIEKELKPILIGEDPFANEKIWDMMYRYMTHGRKGETMMAISAIDCAIWDLKGKYFNSPVWKLIGGPTRDKVRAYASTYTCSLAPKEVTKTCNRLLDEGYTAMKWFFRYGPEDGAKGEEKNLELVKTIRDTVPFSVQLMLDCWMGWNKSYTIKMAKKFEKYEIEWIEEPVMSEKVNEYAEIKKESPIKISGGEHEYTRWGSNLLLEKKAIDFAQPDIMWAGGITECLKIVSLTSLYPVPLIPHGSSMPATINFLFSKPETECPLGEFLTNWNLIAQAPFKEQVYPEKGYFKPTVRPGLGFEIDETKVYKKIEYNDLVNS